MKFKGLSTLKHLLVVSKFFTLIFVLNTGAKASNKANIRELGIDERLLPSLEVNKEVSEAIVPFADLLRKRVGILETNGAFADVFTDDLNKVRFYQRELNSFWKSGFEIQFNQDHIDELQRISELSRQIEEFRDSAAKAKLQDEDFEKMKKLYPEISKLSNHSLAICSNAREYHQMSLDQLDELRREFSEADFEIVKPEYEKQSQRMASCLDELKTLSVDLGTPAVPYLEKLKREFVWQKHNERKAELRKLLESHDVGQVGQALVKLYKKAIYIELPEPAPKKKVGH